MIRVNLISVTPGQTPSRVWLPKEQRSAALGLVLLLGTAVLITSWWLYLRHERLTIEHGIMDAEVELARLKDVAQTVERATMRKAELAERIDLIERLRATMRAPMRLLETVSRAVPHGLWLLEIKQTGTSVQLDGRAMSLTQIPDFAKGLQDSGFFQLPVEIVSTNAEILDDVPVIPFVMKADMLGVGTTAVKASPAVTSPAPTPAPASAPTTAPPTATSSAAGLPSSTTALATAVAPKAGIGSGRTPGGR